MFWWDCCKKSGCPICRDNFDRDDNPDPGPVVEVVNGSWEIKDNKLRADGIGIVICKKRHPHNTPTAIAVVAIDNLQEGNRVRILVNYVDVDNYVFGELEAAAGGLVYYRAGTRALGGETIHDERESSYEVGGVQRIGCCRSEQGLFVSERFASDIAWGCTTAEGRKSGIANMTSDVAEFAGPDATDEYLFEEHYRTYGAGCPECECECIEPNDPDKFPYCMPRTLTATLYDATGSCAALEGLEIDLVYDPTEIDTFAWKGDKDGPRWDGQPGTENYELWLFCDTLRDPGSDQCLNYKFLLCNKGGGLSCSMSWDKSCIVGLGPAICSNDTEQCDPIVLDFGPFTCSGSGPDPPECSVSIAVTE